MFDVDEDLLKSQYILSRCVMCNSNRWKLIRRSDLGKMQIPHKRKYLKVFRDLNAGLAVDIRGDKVVWKSMDAVSGADTRRCFSSEDVSDVANWMPHVQCCLCEQVFWEGPPGDTPQYDSAYVKNLFPELASIDDTAS